MEFWRYKFKNNEWQEENGQIFYSFEDYSDNDLIKELKKRGYCIKKN